MAMSTLIQWKGNPNARAKLTIAELEEKIIAFVDEYHRKLHSGLNTSPLEYWNEHISSKPANPRELDLFLRVRETRKARKDGIEYRKTKYWHVDLGRVVGEKVVIRADGSTIGPPDHIDVYFQDKWVCTAINLDVAYEEQINVGQAKRQQKQHIRREINEARQALKTADEEIKQNEKIREEIQADQTESSEEKPELQKPKTPTKKTPQSFFKSLR